MGGEHSKTTQALEYADGSSPRGRGTCGAWPAIAKWGRFIPAWAGNINHRSGKPQRNPVHPRVGGEHKILVRNRASLIGSSPRGRGTFPLRRLDYQRDRFIPAWAGNIFFTVGKQVFHSVHPRVGGEHARGIPEVFQSAGSSPRGRGTCGLARGAQAGTRFIPAWAGNISERRRKSLRLPVHPRVGGEHARGSDLPRSRCGSSPRGRGTLRICQIIVAIVRFIPAWAGNMRSAGLWTALQTVHPRVGGEHRRPGRKVGICGGSSPRGRGTFDCREDCFVNIRFIPAWAGNIGVQLASRILPPVHPRVGGEHTSHSLLKFMVNF